jgi:iron complex transport system ATP-binding protein
MTAHRVTVQGLDVVIDTNRILEGIDLVAGTGRLLGIIGPNGSGKSTLIRCISRSLTPQSGSIHLEGREIMHFSKKDLARTLSVVPQEANRTFDFNVEDVVMMGRYPHQTLLSSVSVEDREACRDAMATVGVTALGERRITTLSGGEWQRVLIARTLAQESGIVLLDEPTSHLDASHQILILTAFQALVRNGATVIGVFHDLNLASHFCDEIVVLSGGRVAAFGPPSDTVIPAILRDVFSLDAIVGRHPYTGRPVVLPLFSHSSSEGPGKRGHVICGGGSGGWLLPALVAAGCAVTTGVLAMNDSDYETARHLGIPCISEPPFAALSEVSCGALQEALARSDLIVLTEMPIGPGNLGNLRALDACEEPVRLVLLVGRDDGVRGGGIDDYTDGEATALVHRLLKSGRMDRCSLEDILRICMTPPGGEP